MNFLENIKKETTTDELDLIGSFGEDDTLTPVKKDVDTNPFANVSFETETETETEKGSGDGKNNTLLASVLSNSFLVGNNYLGQKVSNTEQSFTPDSSQVYTLEKSIEKWLDSLKESSNPLFDMVVAMGAVSVSTYMKASGIKKERNYSFCSN